MLIAWATDGIAAERVEFNRDIRPILSNNCFKCHGPDEGTREAELRLDMREDAVSDRGGYRAIDEQDPTASAVLQRITAADESERMPPADSGLTLTPQQIELVRRWIEQGAHFEQHWSFRPIERPEAPATDSAWAKNEIDAFVLEKLREHKLGASPEPARNTLIRRVYLDVVGLPPTPEEVNEFVRDQSPDAFERMVDRALASPHYGERWGRHWLDQARYADTNGYAPDGERTMWPYRDWVIRAINNDMPFDQFTIEQLAGDLLPNPTQDQLVATGFHRNTLINEEGGSDDEQFRVEAVVDRVNTTGAVWLGLTIACAQCHTHKFDPISQHDYYRMFAFFNNCEDENKKPPLLAVASEKQRQALAALDSQLGAMKASLADPAADVAKIEAEVKRLEEDKARITASLPETMILRERREPRATHVLLRGDFLRKGDQVTPDAPAVLPPLVAEGNLPTRFDLARWLVSPANPLTARVTVNRVWARYFGRGLVETENDFGLQGTPPTHPQLLDWLAAEFMAPADGSAGWSLKHLHRLILNSATYRQSSRFRTDLAAADPLNKLLARQSRLRVDAEVVRDLSLAASGLLHGKIGGPSVYPPQPADVYAFTQVKREWPTSTGPDRYRRAMYTYFRRSAPHPMLTTFDTPEFIVSCTFRQRSNTPLQSLTMANDETMIEAAQALARRIQTRAGSDDERIAFAYQLCFARAPETRERSRLAAYVEQQRREFASNTKDAQSFAGDPQGANAEEAAAWTALARVLLNLDEFITRE